MERNLAPEFLQIGRKFLRQKRIQPTQKQNALSGELCKDKGMTSDMSSYMTYKKKKVKKHSLVGDTEIGSSGR